MDQLKSSDTGPLVEADDSGGDDTAFVSGRTLKRSMTRDRLSGAAAGAIVVVEPRVLVRDMFERSLRAVSTGRVQAYSSLAEFETQLEPAAVGVMLLCHFGASAGDAISDDLERLRAGVCIPFPVVVVSECGPNAQVKQALESGARGYIPSDMPFDVIPEVLRVIMAGGSYVAASCVIGCDPEGKAETAARPVGKQPTQAAKGKSLFTARQGAVVEAIIHGMANKAIGRKLNMQENTVKVHVRNIMKKLNAKNRTEVAFLASKMLDL